MEGRNIRFRVVECHWLKFSFPHAILTCNANLTSFLLSIFRSWEGCLDPFLVSKMLLWVETGGVLLSGAPPLPIVEMMTKMCDEH